MMIITDEEYETTFNFPFNVATVISSSAMIGENGDNLSLLQQVSYIARVSNPSNQSNYETSERLLSYLIKNNHWSPFEMVNICLEIKTTREVSKQILRHRSFSFQEKSQRYYTINDDDFIVRECRKQDIKNRQKSIEMDASNEADIKLTEQFTSIQQSLIEKEKEYYNFCINNGIAKEVSRVILSEGLVKTTMYMNGSLRSWIHYLKVRCDKTAQKEHIDIAIKIMNEIDKIFPIKKIIYNDA